MSEAKNKAELLIRENPVMVFSKSYCPYCRATKKTLQSLGAEFKVYEMNEESAHLSHPFPSHTQNLSANPDVFCTVL